MDRLWMLTKNVYFHNTIKVLTFRLKRVTNSLNIRLDFKQHNIFTNSLLAVYAENIFVLVMLH